MDNYRSSRNICDPCKSAGDRVIPVGYCTTCDEYLCMTCFACHLRGKATKDHEIVDVINEPKQQEYQRASVTDGIKAVSGTQCGFCGKYLCYCTKDMAKQVDKHSEPMENISRHSLELRGKEVTRLCKNCGKFLCNCSKDGMIWESKECNQIRETEARPRGDYDNVASIDDLAITDSDELRYEEKFRCSKRICIKTYHDSLNCNIISMCMLSNKMLVLVDYENMSFKRLDVDGTKLMGTPMYNTYPLSISKIDGETFTATFPYSQEIRIINAVQGFVVKKTFKTNGRCAAIEHVKGQLYVSFEDPVKIQIFELDGTAKKTISFSKEVQHYCQVPANIAVDPGKDMIYISDWFTNHVLCIDSNGNMIHKYHGELDRPSTIILSPFGSIYICNMANKAVYTMPLDLSEAKVALGRKNSVKGHMAMCFDVSNEHLYLSSGSDDPNFCNYINVFKWK